MFNLRRHLLLLPAPLSLVAILAMACEPVHAAAPKVRDSKGERVMMLLDQASTMHFEDYSPAYVIRAVNALQSLGKKKALERIDSYLENRDKNKDAYGLFWVLRVLFEVPAKQGFPLARLGKPTIASPAKPGTLPRFPIVMVKDIPFLVIRGYFLRGLPEPVETHVAYFRAHGILREQLLAPPASMKGVQEAFLQRWKAAYGDAHAAEALETIKAQIARFGADKEEKPKQLENQPMISKSEALRIAHQDASKMYRDLSQYEATAVLKEGNWQVDYELVVTKGIVMVGGGPHYLISGSSGEIVNRRYEQ